MAVINHYRRLSYGFVGAINNAPTAVIKADKTTGAIPLTVVFNGSDSSDPDPGGAVAKYYWDFGDGTTQTTTTPTVSKTFSTAISRTVSLVVEDLTGLLSNPQKLVIVPTGAVTPPPVIERKTITNPWLTLVANKKAYNDTKAGKDNKAYLVQAVNRLRNEADGLLTAKVEAICPHPTSYKDSTGAIKPLVLIGSDNDYLSLAPYWWPDKTKTDGLPYVNLGKGNPEASTIPDSAMLQRISMRIETLGHACYFLEGVKDSGNNLLSTKYARRASEFMDAFFVNPATRMNPNLKFAQIVRGRDDNYGRSEGFVDFEDMSKMVDGFLLCCDSPGFDPNVKAGFLAWIQELFNWMTKTWATAPLRSAGLDDYHHHRIIGLMNNHIANIRTAIELLLTSFSLLLGNEVYALNRINNIIKDVGSTKGHLSKCIMGTGGTFTKTTTFTYNKGAMPHEMDRHIPITYTEKSADFWTKLALTCEVLGIDLWNYVSPGGSGIKQMYNTILDYANNPATWPDAARAKQAYTTADTYRWHKSTIRKATGNYPADAAFQAKAQTYLAKLDTFFAATNGHSEKYYREGNDWKLLTHRLGYTW